MVRYGNGGALAGEMFEEQRKMLEVMASEKQIGSIYRLENQLEENNDNVNSKDDELVSDF